jgi:acyl-CoA thioester hydrolase
MLPVAESSAHRSTRFLVRVRFCDTDLMGIVHHGKYFEYLEAARVEWLRRRGVTYTSWTARGVHLAVASVTFRYRKPSRFDDVLAIDAELGLLRHASLEFRYRVSCGSELRGEGSTLLACVGDDGQLLRMDDAMLEVFRSAETIAAVEPL